MRHNVLFLSMSTEDLIGEWQDGSEGNKCPLGKLDDLSLIPGPQGGCRQWVPGSCPLT